MISISHQNRWEPWYWRSKITSALQGGGPTTTQRMIISWLYLERLKILQTTQMNNQINPTGSQQRNNQTESGTSHPGFWKSQKGECKKKPRMENNIGGERNTALAKSSGFSTSQKITGSKPVPHWAVEEELSHQARDTATIRRPSLSISRLTLWPPNTKVISKPSCPIST